MRLKLFGNITLLSMLVTVIGCYNDKPDESLPVTDNIAVSFSSHYAGYANTRATLNNYDSVMSKGIGIFAMYTSGSKKYDPADAGGSSITAFTANYIDNFHLRYYESSTGESSWYYVPLRYWPGNADEFLSFTAYAPFRNEIELYTYSSGNMQLSSDLEGASYTNLNVTSDKSKMTDLLYADAAQIANMQYYTLDGGETWHKTGNAFVNDDSHHTVLLNMKHATARIAIDISSSALASPTSDYYAVKGTLNATDGIEYTTKQITVNKVVLLGDNTSATDATPKGAFYSKGYLNLGIPTSDQPLWVADETADKICVTYDNTSTVETVRGKGFQLAPDNDWQPGADTDAPNIAGNVITGWRTSVTDNGDGTYTAVGGVTEIGSAQDGYLFVVPQDFSQDSGDHLYVYIDYTVKDTSTNTDTNKSGYVQIKENFEAGKAYVIHIDITNL